MSFFDRPPVHDFPDRALREALEHPHNLHDLVTQVRPDLAAKLDFDHMRVIRPDFLLEDWRGRQADLLCLVPLRDEPGGQVLVCLLVEHQSKPDPLLPLRLLIYAVLFWEQQWKEYERQHAIGESLRLTPVVPIVFHTGPREWASNRTVGDLFAGPEELRAWAPTWPIAFWDLSSKSAEELLGAEGAFAKFLAVVREEQAGPERFRQVFEETMQRLEPLASADKMRWADLLWMLISWAGQRRPAEERDGLQAAATASQQNVGLKKEVGQMAETTWKSWGQVYKEQLAKEMEEQLTKEIEKQLTKEIEKRLTKEVEEQSLRSMLLMLLGDLSKDLPEALVAEIQACHDLDRLRAAVRRTRSLTTLDQFQL